MAPEPGAPQPGAPEPGAPEPGAPQPGAPQPGSFYHRPLWLNQRLGDATGRGIRVAVIDSGYGDGTAADYVAQGINWVDAHDELRLKQPSEDNPESRDTRDRIGHGTAIAHIIRTLAPEVELIPLRVFGRRLETSPEVIVAALEWAAENEVQVVNLSLGSRSAGAKVPLYRACERARRSGCIVVSAMPIGAERIYPACFEHVISVTTTRFGNAFDLEHLPAGPADFAAHGEPVANSKGAGYGSSMAAPHLSAMVALLREKLPKADFQGIRDLLIELAAASAAARASRPT